MRMTLLVLVPLLSGLVCWPLRERAVVERLNLLAFAIVAVLAAWLGADVLARGTVEAFGGFLRADGLSALVVCLTAFVALACAIYAVGYLREEERAGKINARLLHQGRSRPNAHLEARRLLGSARAVGGVARRRVHQLRALRHHAFLRAGREMPRPRLHGQSPRAVRRGVHPRGRTVRARAEEF